MIDERMLNRVDALIEKGQQVAQTVRQLPVGYIGFDDPVSSDLFSEWRSQSIAFLTNLVGTDHSYTINFQSECEKNGIVNTKRGIGVLRAVRNDIQDGFLATFRQQVHAEIFDDFIAQAEYFVKEGGYTDAAVVIAVGTLEEHLRQLCTNGRCRSIPRPCGRISTRPPPNVLFGRIVRGSKST